MYVLRIKEDVWEQWIIDGLIVIDDNIRFISDFMDNNDFVNELRSMNQKLEVYYGEQEELY